MRIDKDEDSSNKEKVNEAKDTRTDFQEAWKSGLKDDCPWAVSV